MSSIRRRPDGTWAVTQKAADRAIGGAFLVIAALAEAIVIPVIRADFDAWPLLLVPVIAAVVGLWYAFAGRVAVVDLRRRSITRDGVELGAADIKEVALTYLADPHASPVGTGTFRTWSVALRSRLGDADRLRRLGPFFEGLEASIIDATYDEAEARRVGRWLAKALRLPLVDLTGDGFVERSPADLDEPLSSRLARRDPPPADPGPPPAGLELREDDRGLELRWYNDTEAVRHAGFNLGMMIVLLVLAVGFVVAGGEHSLALAGAFGGMALFNGVTWILAHRGHGPVELEVREDHIRFTTLRPWRRVQTLSLRELEHISDYADPPAFVGLVGDTRVLRLPLSDAHRRWVRLELEHWLVTHGR